MTGAVNDVYTDFSTFSGLRAQARRGDEEATDKVARQFESLFVQMMLKSMRDATPNSELFGSGMRTYQDLFDRQIGLDLTAARGIGIADMIRRQLAHGPAAGGGGGGGGGGGEELYLRRRTGSTPVEAAAASDAPSAAVTPVARPATGGVHDVRFDKPAQFVQALLPHAREAGGRLGVDPKVLLAQAALETGWGQHVIRDGAGQSSNNFFGIKADSRWQGARVQVPTLEAAGGGFERVRADFRAYGSASDGFSDYVDFLSANARYASALAVASDPAEYVRGLQSAGYATDPKYADKILGILRRGDLDALTARADPYAMMREVF